MTYERAKQELARLHQQACDGLLPKDAYRKAVENLLARYLRASTD